MSEFLSCFGGSMDNFGIFIDGDNMNPQYFEVLHELVKKRGKIIMKKFLMMTSLLRLKTPSSPPFLLFVLSQSICEVLVHGKNVYIGQGYYKFY